MKTTYFDADDILVFHLSDKPIVREVSEDWDTHVSYAADNTIVEVVILDVHQGSVSFTYAQSTIA